MTLMKFLYLIFTIFVLTNCSFFSFLTNSFKDMAVLSFIEEIQKEAIEYKIEKAKKANKPIKANVYDKELFKSMIKVIKPEDKNILITLCILKVFFGILFLVWIYLSAIDFFGYLISDDISGYVMSAVIRCISVPILACLCTEYIIFPSIESLENELNYTNVYNLIMKKY